MTDRDIVERLHAAINNPQEEFPVNAWGPIVTALFSDALKEIERLRRLAGAVSPGESFNDIRRAAKTP